MNALFNRFVKDESGATAIEYALIASLMAAALITAMSSVTGGISTAFTKVGSKLSGAAIN